VKLGTTFLFHPAGKFKPVAAAGLFKNRGQMGVNRPNGHKHFITDFLV